ncbi:MAG: ABC transporter permease [Candidatus Nanohaloarchaea archaeon]
MNREEIGKYVGIYWLYFRQYWKSRLVYKKDFLLGTTAHLTSVSVSLIFLTLVFTQIESLNGWSFNEMLFLSGFGGVVVFTHNVFLYNATRIGEDYILTGDFDRFLVRPLDPLFQVYADNIRDSNLPKIIANIALVIYASLQLGLEVGLIKLIYAGLSLGSGILIMGSIYLLFSSTAFWTGTSRSAVWLLFRMSNFRKYPFEIFGIAVQALLVTLVPLAFATIFPASFILGKEGQELWQVILPLAGPLFFYISYRFWRFGLGRYSSTGS